MFPGSYLEDENCYFAFTQGCFRNELTDVNVFYELSKYEKVQLSTVLFGIQKAGI
jgi:hypothetical protein